MKAENVDISHPDKILYSEANFTKEDVADYYQRIAEHMIPHIKDRPLTFKRYPDGIDQDGFFNKHIPDHFPDYVKRVQLEMRSKKGDHIDMASADEAADLVYFAGQNVIEIHMGLSSKAHLDKPDQIIFDFDPSDDDFEKVRKSALKLKNMLDEMNLPGFVKTSGSRGAHVHIPLKPEQTFADIKPCAKKLAKMLHERLPEITTLEQRKNKRSDKVFIDILRNEYGQTSISPYSLRAKPCAPIATPINWDELKDKGLTPQKYTLANIFRRLSRKKDPWQDFYKSRIEPDKLIRKIGEN